MCDCTTPLVCIADRHVLTPDSALGQLCGGEGSARVLRELLLSPVLQDPAGEGGVQQGEGAGADLRGRGGSEQVRGLLCLHHDPLSHGEVGLQQVLLLLQGDELRGEDGHPAPVLRPGRPQD